MRPPVMSFRCTAAAAVIGCGFGAGAFAGVIPPSSYDYSLIATTADPGFTSLMSAALNSQGEVVFDAVTDSGATGVYLYSGGAVSLLAADAGSPVLNDDGFVAYVMPALGGGVDIYLYDPIAGTASEVYSAAGALAAGQLSINNAGELAFWRLDCESKCASLTQSILELPSDEAAVIATATAALGGTSSVIGPDINDSGVIAFRRVDADNLSSIELFESGVATPVFEALADGIVSSPALNDSSTVAYYAADSVSAAGIYAIAAVRAAPVRVVALDGDLSASLFTAPVLNNNDQIAFAASDAIQGEGIYVATSIAVDADVVKVLGEGAALFGSNVVGTLQALDLNDDGLILFRASLADGTTAIGIAEPQPTGTCDGDLNGDSAVNVADLLVLLSVWGPCVDCDEDLNGDDQVNVADMLILLGAWGGCP